MGRGRRHVNAGSKRAELAQRNRVAAQQRAARRALAEQRDEVAVPAWSEGAATELEGSTDPLLRATAELIRAEMGDDA